MDQTRNPQLILEYTRRGADAVGKYYADTVPPAAHSTMMEYIRAHYPMGYESLQDIVPIIDRYDISVDTHKKELARWVNGWKQLITKATQAWRKANK